MPVQLLGWLCVLVGLVFLLVGVAGALRATLSARGSGQSPGPSAQATLWGAVKALLVALMAAPLWLGCALLGLLVFFLGARVALYGLNLFPGLGAS